MVLATRRKRTGKDVSTDKVSGELRCVLRDEEEVTRGLTGYPRWSQTTGMPGGSLILKPLLYAALLLG